MYLISNELFSEVLGRLAVPLFFLMSGYLFFYKTDFDINTYKRKLKSRFRTLLIPYILWNAAWMILLFITGRQPLDLGYIISCFVGQIDSTGTMAYPIAYQFWFIRDLMVAVMFTPLIYWFIKHTNTIGVLIIGLCWLLKLKIPTLCMYGFSSEAWFFFMLGAYFSINKKNILNEISLFGKWIYIAYTIIAIADVVTKGLDGNSYVHKIGILLGIICCLKLAEFLIESRNVNMPQFLVTASFFVFAVHDRWILTFVRKAANTIFAPTGDFSMVLLYFAEVVATILISLLIYYVLRKIAPQFTMVITGGR